MRSRGLTALLVQVEGGQQAAGGSSLFSAKLSDNDLAWATRQLASLLGASLPLEAALSATVEQAEKSLSLETMELQRDKKYAVILGHEVHGVQQPVVDACDGCIEIPQFGTKHSLNVSVAAGIVFWDFFRQLSR